VISAAELNGEQKNQVKEALQKRKPDAKFKLSYEIDPSILGGLQIFAGS
jgi:F-type H+-transporting ATPase subunit O